MITKIIPPPADNKGPTEPWTQREITLLHEIVQDYDRAKWFRGQVKWWAVWLLGLPTLALTVWEPLVRLWKLFRGV